MIATLTKPKLAGTISNFPNFTKLGIEHKPVIDAINLQFEPYSDFTFVNLFTWSLEGCTEVAIHNGNLVVRLPDYISGEMIYSLLGNTKVDESVEAIFTLTDHLSLVPEVVIASMSRSSDYVITEDRNSDDYIYEISALSNMQGLDFKKKRNKVNRFVRAYGDAITAETINDVDAYTAQEIRVLFEDWARACGKNRAEYKAEQMAIDRLLLNLDELHLEIMIVRIYDKIRAFSINEILTNGYAVCHFEKALPVHEDLYAFIIHYTAQVLDTHGVKKVNWEQDLGLPGLRQAKTSYKPIGFLRKYSIALNN